MINVSDEQVTKRIGLLRDSALSKIERHEIRSEIESLFESAWTLTDQIENPENRRIVRMLLNYYRDENLRNYRF